MGERGDENSEAYRLGLRPNMVIKAMTGTNGDERTQMWELDEKVSLFYIRETIRLCRFPIDFILQEGVPMLEASEATLTDVDRRILERRAYNEVDESRNYFPLVGALAAVTIAPPV